MVWWGYEHSVCCILPWQRRQVTKIMKCWIYLSIILVLVRLLRCVSLFSYINATLRNQILYYVEWEDIDETPAAWNGEYRAHTVSVGWAYRWGYSAGWRRRQPIRLWQLLLTEIMVLWYIHKADSRFAPIQWGTSLQSNDVSHCLGANLESDLHTEIRTTTHFVKSLFIWVPGILIFA